MRKEIPVLDRFFSKVNKTDTCWLWIGCKNKQGYGKFQVNGKPERAHRWLYEHMHGKLPKELCVCTTCGNHSCVNPDHLVTRTLEENNALINRDNYPVKPKYNQIDDETRQKIKESYKPYEFGLRQVAKLYKVSTATVLSIVKEEEL